MLDVLVQFYHVLAFLYAVISLREGKAEHDYAIMHLERQSRLLKKMFLLFF